VTVETAADPGHRPARVMITRVGLVAALIIAATVGTVLVVASQHSRHRESFSWFHAQPAPASWHKFTLPDGTGTLAAPPSLVRLPADPGTVAVGLPAGAEELIYLDATPRQGDETLPGWAAFRIAHLRDDDTAAATLDAHAEHLTFVGGTGSCVLDDYVTQVGAHHYREIACLVQGAHGGSVIVAATPAADWDHYRPLLEQAVSAYSSP
jgi:hypothetical protein